MKTLIALIAIPCTLGLASLSAHASCGNQQQQNKGASTQQYKPKFKGAHVVEAPEAPSITVIYKRLMNQQQQQTAQQSK